VADAISIFTPEQILGQALDLFRLSAATRARLVETETVDGRTIARLSIETEVSGISRTLALDDADHRVREDSLKAEVGEVLWKYRDYHEIDGGLVVPYQIEVWRQGELRERFSILDLSLNAKASGNPFSMEGPKGRDASP
jgi:hypothetical protein